MITNESLKSENTDLQKHILPHTGSPCNRALDQMTMAENMGLIILIISRLCSLLSLDPATNWVLLFKLLPVAYRLHNKQFDYSPVRRCFIVKDRTVYDAGLTVQSSANQVNLLNVYLILRVS